VDAEDNRRIGLAKWEGFLGSRRAAILKIVLVWLVLGLLLHLAGTEQDGSINDEFERWFLFFLMAVCCLVIGDSFDDGTLRGFNLGDTVGRVLMGLVLAFFATGVIFFAAMASAILWGAIL